MTDSGERVVILGCGYLGAAIARVLVGGGGAVWGASRNREGLDALRGLQGFHPVCADFLDPDWERALPDAADAAIFCAGSERASEAAYRSVYLCAQRNALAWCARSGVRRFVFTGSTAVYPQTDGRWVHEDDAGRGDPSAAGRILMEAEALSLPLLRSKALESAVVLRLAGLYGPGRHGLLDRLRSGEHRFAGSPDTWLNLVHRDDAAAAVVRALDPGLPSGRFVFNVSDGAPAPRGEVIRWLAGRVSAREPEFDPEREPARGGLRRGGRAGGVPNRRVGIDRIRKELGWRAEYTAFREGYEMILGGGSTRP